MGVETKLFLTKDEIRLDLPTFSSPQTHTRTKVKVSAPFSQGGLHCEESLTCSHHGEQSQVCQKSYLC